MFALIVFLNAQAQLYYTEQNGVVLEYSVMSEDEKTAVVTGTPSEYSIYNEQTGEYSATIYQDIERITKISVPGEINGYTVKIASGFNGLPKLEEITFSEGIEELGENTLAGCVNLAKIYLPHSLQQINKDCFNFCTALTEITLPQNLNRFGGYWGVAAFVGCNNLKKLNILCEHPEWILTMINQVYQDSDGNPLPEYTNIRETVESIYLGPNVQEFSEHFPFKNLKSIVVDEANSELDSREGCNAAILTMGNKLIIGCNTTRIPNSVATIGHNAFDGTNIEKVQLGSSTKIIESYAFANCNMLTEVSFDEEEMFIGNNAFDNCQNLKKVTFGPKAQLQTPLSNCPALEEITLGENWSLYDSYDAMIFRDCYNVKLVTLGDTYYWKNTNLWTNQLYDDDNPDIVRRDMVVRSFIKEPSPMQLYVWVLYNPETGTTDLIYPQKLYVPLGTKALYEATEDWNLCSEIIEMEEDADRGDVNNDGKVNITDIVFIINTIAKESTYNSTADINSDGKVNITDIVDVINIIARK